MELEIGDLVNSSYGVYVIGEITAEGYYCSVFGSSITPSLKKENLTLIKKGINYQDINGEYLFLGDKVKIIYAEFGVYGVKGDIGIITDKEALNGIITSKIKININGKVRGVGDNSKLELIKETIISEQLSHITEYITMTDTPHIGIISPLKKKISLIDGIKDEMELLEKERDNYKRNYDSLYINYNNFKSELDKINKINSDLINENIKLKEKIDSIFIIKKSKSTSKIKKSSLWDNVILPDSTYKKLLLSFNKRMPMLLKGPSGVGKSKIVRTLANDKGVGFVEFNFNGDTTVEHLLGHKILVGTTKKSDDPMKWEDGPLTDAVRNGKVFLGHELNASNPEIQFILNGLLELDENGELGNLSIQGNNGEVIKPHPNFRFYGTYNPGYLGTKSFGTSIMSRFIGVEINPLSPDDELKFLLVLYPKLITEINLLVKLEEQLRKDKNFSYDISTRDLIQTLMFIDGGFNIREALETTVYSSCQISLDIETLNKKIEKLFSN